MPFRSTLFSYFIPHSPTSICTFKEHLNHSDSHSTYCESSSLPHQQFTIKSSRRLHLYHLCCVKKRAALCGNIKLVTSSGGWYLSWLSRMYLGREDSSLWTTAKTCLKKPLCLYNKGAGVSAFTYIVWLYHSNMSVKVILYSFWWAVIAHHRYTTLSHYMLLFPDTPGHTPACVPHGLTCIDIRDTWTLRVMMRLL